MIETIGELTVQQSRVEQSTTVHTNHVVHEKIEKAAKERKIETTDESQKASDESGPNEETRFNLTTNRIVIEKYSKDGRLLLQVPSIHEEQA